MSSETSTATGGGGGGTTRHSNLSSDHVLLESHLHSSKHEEASAFTPHDVTNVPKKRSGTNPSRYPDVSDPLEGRRSEYEASDLVRRLEEVTLERDTLKGNHERTQALLEGKVRRLEQQVKEATRVSGAEVSKCGISPEEQCYKGHSKR